MARLRTPADITIGYAVQQYAERSSSRRAEPERTCSEAPRRTRKTKLADEECTASSQILRVKESTPRSVIRAKQVRLTPLRSLTSTKSIEFAEDSDDLSLRPRRNTGVELRLRLRSPTKPSSLFQDRSVADTEFEIHDESDSDQNEDSNWEASTVSSQSEDDSQSSRTVKPASGQLGLADSMLALQISPAKPKTSGEDERKTDKSSRDVNKKCFEDLSDKENTPIRIHSKADTTPERPRTPSPSSPSKSRLQSPSKSKHRIPSGNLRPSLDAFWTVDTVNAWNDQYSPEKVLKSPRKAKLLFDQDSTASPLASPRKLESPTKRTKAEIQARKTFNEEKPRLAADFLSELDQVITQGEISRLAASTGGVHIVWSKTLNSTAGRANWRRQTTRIRAADGTTQSEEHTHHASIELAEKVIDSHDRLLNVLAHEFCHLANFMISEAGRARPHGPEFQAWGRRCTAAFAARGVHVTTTHSYAIDYRYIWECAAPDCAQQFKRHSKSIDPAKHTCGRCRGQLVQIKPVPRKGRGTMSGTAEGDVTAAVGAGSTTSGPTGYAAYVKEHFAEVKKSVPPGSPHKVVMEALGKKYRAEKDGLHDHAMPALRLSKVDDDVAGAVDDIAKAIEVVVLDSD